MNSSSSGSVRVLGIATRIMVMAIIVSVVLLFVGIGALVLIHVCIVGRAFRRGLRHIAGAAAGADHPAAAVAGLSKEDIETLPCFEFKSDAAGDCAVCLEGFQIGDRCRLLPTCKHSFHAQCVDSWLLKRSICPICRSFAGAVDRRKEVVIGFPVIGGGGGPSSPTTIA